MRRGAGEGLTGLHHESGCEEKAHRLNLTQVPDVAVEREQQEHRPEGEYREPRPRYLDRHDDI